MGCGAVCVCGGYDGWLEWCNTLYEPDAYYNVYGKRLTLKEYQDIMGQLFELFTMELGPFEKPSRLRLARQTWLAPVAT